jgi:preprotein translocase SecE subunit
MSVAETPKTETITPNVQQQFAIGSAIGAGLLLAALALVFGALPLYWGEAWDSIWASNPDMQKNLFLADSLLILLEIAVIFGLLYAGYQLLQKDTQPGTRAGATIGAVYLFLCLWLTFWLGGTMESQFANQPMVGLGVMAAIFIGLAAAAGYLYLMVPGWMGLMESVEHQGWFHGTSYKGNQGVRVRRGTIMGILAVGISGIITLYMHRTFGSDRADYSNDWYWLVPFTRPNSYYVYLMFKIHVILPIVLGVLLLWVAWRVVNIPAFADFMIATEAEMNKVSWTSRKRLVQDTVVVLTTVFLFTMFLFVVDIVWIKVLSAPYIQVLLYDPREKQAQQQESAKW